MANRRMFSKSITSSSNFLMMPTSAQNLYFHLGMNADDDGFCEHFSIMRMVEAKPDDLKILHAKSFVRVFDDRVLVITDWKENNYLRNDRYTPSKYLEIYKEELKQLSSGIPVVDQVDTQVRLGKDRKGKVSTELSKDRAYGDPQINELVSFFKGKLGGSLDGKVQENRRFCKLLLERFKKDYPSREPIQLVKGLIEAGMNDSFHGKNATGFKYLFYHAQKIIQSVTNNNKGKQIISST